MGRGRAARTRATEYDLKFLLKNLDTEESKNLAITAAVGKGWTRDPKHIKMAIEIYEREGSFLEAGRLAEELGDSELAIDFYSRSSLNLKYAAEVAERIGDLKRAIEFYEREGKYEEVARLYEKLGNFKKAKAYRTLSFLLEIP